MLGFLQYNIIKVKSLYFNRSAERGVLWSVSHTGHVYWHPGDGVPPNIGMASLVGVNPVKHVKPGYGWRNVIWYFWISKCMQEMVFLSHAANNISTIFIPAHKRPIVPWNSLLSVALLSPPPLAWSISIIRKLPPGTCLVTSTAFARAPIRSRAKKPVYQTGRTRQETSLLNG